MSLNSKQKQILNRYQGEFAWGNLPKRAKRSFTRIFKIG